jgi:hypothetical protein
MLLLPATWPIPRSSHPGISPAAHRSCSSSSNWIVHTMSHIIRQHIRFQNVDLAVHQNSKCRLGSISISICYIHMSGGASERNTLCSLMIWSKTRHVIDTWIHDTRVQTSSTQQLEYASKPSVLIPTKAQVILCSQVIFEYISLECF